MVLLHGWCSRRADLAPPADALRGSHRVISLDLPGHGDSDVPTDEDRLSVASFADDTAALGLRGTVVIAHSGGAAVAVELAVRRPDLVAAVATLDGTLGFPAELLEQTAPLLAALRGPAWCEVIAGFVAAGFLPSDDQELLRRTVEDVQLMPQHVVAGVGERIADWDAEAAWPPSAPLAPRCATSGQARPGAGRPGPPGQARARPHPGSGRRPGPRPAAGHPSPVGGDDRAVPGRRQVPLNLGKHIG
jgi:pimeloyl-ACP methyl ester carboxylesterase